MKQANIASRFSFENVAINLLGGAALSHSFFCLLSQWRSTYKDHSLLLEEQIISFKSTPSFGISLFHGSKQEVKKFVSLADKDGGVSIPF